MTELINKLNSLKYKKVKMTYSDGEEVICKPLQYLEEDYESYLVEVLEQSTNFPPGQLLEVEGDEIKSIIEITQ